VFLKMIVGSPMEEIGEVLDTIPNEAQLLRFFWICIHLN